jgi:hypothetical protein
MEWGNANTSAIFEHDSTNKIVDFVLNVFGNGVLNGEEIATLPPAMRPPTNATFDVFGIQDDNNIHLLYCTVYTNGAINISSSDYNSKIMACTANGKFKTV